MSYQRQSVCEIVSQTKGRYKHSLELFVTYLKEHYLLNWWTRREVAPLEVKCTYLNQLKIQFSVLHVRYEHTRELSKLTTT